MEDFQGHVHEINSHDGAHDDGIRDFPSMMMMGITHLPGKVAERPPNIKRWNAGWEARFPHTLHHPQHLDRPILNPESLGDHLLRHSSCRGLFGPTHTCLHLAFRAEAALKSSPNIARQAAEAHENSVHLLQNLKKRSHAEMILKKTQAQQREWEKNYWLGDLLRNRDMVRAERFGRYAEAHSATVRRQQGEISGVQTESCVWKERAPGKGVDSRSHGYPSLPMSPMNTSAVSEGGGAAAVSKPHAYPGGGKTTYPHPFTRIGKRTLGITQRATLESLGSVHQCHHSQTFLPSECIPRRPPHKAPALKYLKGRFWSRIQQDGNPPPTPPPLSPPTLSSRISATSEKVTLNNHRFGLM